MSEAGPGATTHEKGMHPNYMAVWAALFVLTIVEILAAQYLGETLGRGMLIVVLMALAIWKAALVAMYYMHLKFERGVIYVVALGPLVLVTALLLALLQDTPLRF